MRTRASAPARRRWRLALAVATAALLALGFAGYLHPDMRLDWASVARMCGLR